MLDMQVPQMKRIAVDFDGTLVKEVWPGIGDWLPGAVDGLKQLAREFDEVVIWTCRTAEVDTDEKTPRDNSDQINAIEDMLVAKEMPLNVTIWTRPYKPPADFYLDNRAIRFNGDWDVALAAVLGSSDRGMAPTHDDEKQMFTLHVPDDGIEWGTHVRVFETGATRDTDDGKFEYAGFLDPHVLRRFAAYMHEHRIQSDGTLRSSSNWKKGIPMDAYMQSGFRHFMDWWTGHEDKDMDAEFVEEALCALMFNVMGYLREFMLEYGS